MLLRFGSLRPAVAALTIVASAPAAHAATIALAPDNARVGLVAYLFGLMPRPGRFTAFSGRLDLDPAHPDNCRVSLDIQAGSLQMAARLGALARGPGVLDVSHHPDITFAGSCGLDRTAGQLTMHGVTRQVAMKETRAGDRFDAAGTLNRRDFGMTGWPGAIGSTVEMTFSITLPAQIAAALPPQRSDQKD